MATAAQTKAEPPLEFHKGVDYACLLLPGQTTDKPLAHIYGIDRDVTRYGNLFAAAPELLAALKKTLLRLEAEFSHFPPGTEEWASIKEARAAIAKAEGR